MNRRLASTTLMLLLVPGLALAGGQKFTAELSGAEEVPVPVMTATTGEANFRVNKQLTRIDFEVEIDDGVRILAGPGGHLHCAPFGENGPVVAFLAAGLPVGFNGDVEIEASLDDGSILNDACGATIAELVESMNLGRVYVNLHSARNPAGEVRGQIYAKTQRGKKDEDDDEDDDR